MNELLSQVPEFWISAALIGTRVFGIISLLPQPSDRRISWGLRCVGCAALTMLVVPVFPVALPSSMDVRWLALSLFNEIAMGCLLGTGVHLLLFGVQVCGQLVSQMSGVSLAGVYQNNTEGISAITKLLDLLAMSLFLLIGGHRVIIAALLDTFYEWPPGQVSLTVSSLEMLADLLTHSFVLGLEAAMPVVVVMLVSNLLAGLLGRLMPQMNVLLLSSGLNSLLLLAVLFVSVGAMAWTLQDHLEPFAGEIVKLCQP